MPATEPVVLARAGAITTAMSTGVAKGRRMARGLLRLSLSRRPMSVANAPNHQRLRELLLVRSSCGWLTIVDIVRSPFCEVSGRETVASELEEDVIEGGCPGTDPRGG